MYRSDVEIRNSVINNNAAYGDENSGGAIFVKGIVDNSGMMADSVFISNTDIRGNLSPIFRKYAANCVLMFVF